MRFALIIILIFSSSSIFAQNRFLNVKGLEGQRISHPKVVSDSIEAVRVAKSILGELYQSGFLAATVDSFSVDSTNILLRFHIGNRFKWAQLRKGNLKPDELSAIDPNQKTYIDRPFNPTQLSRLYERAIVYFENNGYPFASVRLDSIEFDSSQTVKAAIYVNRGQKYSLDSVEIKGNSNINKNYLLRHLDIKIGEDYQEKDISNSSFRIKEIPFVQEQEKTEVLFFEDYVKLILHLEKKNASRFDGVLGLLTSEEDGSIELTGDVDLNLVNAFNRGESLGFNWRKLKGNSQDLQIGFSLPYFLNSPFGIDAKFKLFRRDTTFLDLISRIGVNYTIGSGKYIRLFAENKSSSLLSKNRFLNTTNSSVPPFGDVRISLFGVGYRLQKLDYLYNPRKGYFLESNFAVGRKRLQKIAALEEIQPNIYDDFKLKTIQYNGDLKLQFFQPLGRRSTLLFANQSATTYSENLYQNELLRIGGLKLLRGFDEESINVSTYSIFTLEYRFLLDRNSFFSFFTDGGFYESRSLFEYSRDTPLGIGAGISFETAAGIFTFNYAVGRQFDNPIDLRAAKVHFGFINFF